MAKDSELSPERLAVRQRTQKRIRLAAMERQAAAIHRQRFTPGMTAEKYAMMEAAHKARVEKIKAKHPDWFK